MKVSILLFVVWATTLTFAGGLPNGYERMWIWYAYRIDCLRPSGNRVMAPGAPKGCNMLFVELMDYIDGYTTKSGRVFQPILNGRDQSKEMIPDIDRIAKHIEKEKWTHDVQHSKVISPAPNGYVNMITRIGATMGDAQNDATIPKNAVNKVLFTNMYQALAKARGHRIRVNNAKLLTQFTLEVKPKSITKVTKISSHARPIVNIEGTVRLEANNHIPSLEARCEQLKTAENTGATPESRHYAVVTGMTTSLTSCYAGNCGKVADTFRWR